MFTTFDFDPLVYAEPEFIHCWSPYFVKAVNFMTTEQRVVLFSSLPTVLRRQPAEVIFSVTNSIAAMVAREFVSGSILTEEVIAWAVDTAMERNEHILVPTYHLCEHREQPDVTVKELHTAGRTARKRKFRRSRALRFDYAGFDTVLPVYAKTPPPEPYVGKPRPNPFVRRLIRAIGRLKRFQKREKKAVQKHTYSWLDYYTPNRVQYQSGKVLRQQKREERDEAQRKSAVFRRKMRYRAIPKLERERKVYLERKKRIPVEDPMDIDEDEQTFCTPDAMWDSLDQDLRNLSIAREFPCRVQNQSGRVVSGLMGAAATAALGAIGLACKLLKRSDKLVSGAHKFVESLNSALESIKKHFGQLWIVPTVVAVYFSLRHVKDMPAISTAIVVTALAQIVGPKVWNVVSKFFPSGDRVLQSSFDTGILPKLLTTLFTFSVFKRKMSPVLMSEFLKRVSMADRMTAGWETFSKWILQSIEGLINFVRAFFGKERISLIKNSKSHLYEWAKRVDKLSCREATSGGDISPELLDEMVDVIRLGYEYRDLYRGLPVARTIDECLAKAVTCLAPYQGSLNARHNYRFEPAAVMLIGQPGIGKTLMAMPFCAAVMLESGLIKTPCTTEDIMKNVWQKGNSEYWNGYAGQTCLVMDDAFQARANNTDRENDYMSLIRMVSTWSMPLNFADLASKGKIYFGSKFIFGTTNLASIDSEARTVLQEPEAVARRINFPFAVRVIKKYTLPDGKLDYQKYMEAVREAQTNELPIDRFPWHIWEAAKHNFLTGITSNDWQPFKNVLLEVSRDLKQRTLNFTSAKNSLSSFIGGYNPSEVELQSGHKVVFEGGDTVMYIKNANGEVIKCDGNVTWEVDEKGIMRPAVEVIKLDFAKSCDELKDWQQKTQEFFKRHRFLDYVATGIVLGAFGLFLKQVFGGHKVAKVQSNRPLQSKRPKEQSVQLQAPDSNIATNIYGNSYKLVVESDVSPEIIGQVVFLVSDLAVQPEHFTARLRDKVRTGEYSAETPVRFRSAINSSFSFTMSLGKYLNLRRVTHADKDVEFVRFEGVRAHRRITANVIRECDVQHLGGYKARLDICAVDDGNRVVLHNQRRIYTAPSLKFGTDLAVSGRKTSRYFRYDAPTDVGDCGAPLCILDNSSFSGRSLIGIHVAGERYRGWGYASIVTQELIHEAMSKMETIDDQFERDLADRGVVFQAGHELPFSSQGSFLPLGTVAKPVSICPNTSFYPTDLFGAFGEYDYMPAPLKPVYREGVLVFPMEKAIEPYSSAVHIYEQPWLRQALHVAMRPLMYLTRDMPRRLYTFEEAVLGVPEEKFRSVPRNTAAGFPYVYDVRDGKRSFFGTADEYDLTNSKAVELRERVDFILTEASKGVRLSHVFVDFLKDELRSPAKVEAVATRLISSAPLDYTIAWRMMFGSFASSVMRVHTLSGMAPGICTYTDWHLLVERLTVKGKKCFDGDFKAFDSSEQPCIHDLILDFINNWYDDGPVNAKIRRVLWQDLVHSRHIGGTGFDQRHIYQWNKSLPSGHPFTTIVNSIYSLFLLVGAYISITGNPSNFWANVSSVTYGDDNVSNVSDEMVPVFNQRTVAEALAREFKVKYTPGNKTGDYQEEMTLGDMTFLKRGIKLRQGEWLCPLELDSFLYTAYWCKNKKLESTIIIDVLENALLELSMHDESVWNTYAPLLEQELLERGHVPQAPVEQNQYLMVLRSRGDMWY